MLVDKLYEYLYNTLKLIEATTTGSRYRAFITLNNDEITTLRLSKHFSTKRSIKRSKKRNGKPDVEYHLIVDRTQSEPRENDIYNDGMYSGINVMVRDINLEEFNDGGKRKGIIDEIIALLTNRATPSNTNEIKQYGKMNCVSESRLRSIIRESINRLLLTEDRGSRSMKSARNYAVSVLGDKQEAVDLVNDVRDQLELHNAAEAFVLVGTRMRLNNEYDDTTKDKLINVIRLIAAKYLGQYNNDLNGLSAQELVSKHSNDLQAMRDDERNEVSQMQFNGNSDYDIVRIDSFKQALEYGYYTDWCVTQDENYYNRYTSNGINQFYFCLRNGFEEVPQEEGENFPLDEYGLSMFAVRVDEDGNLLGCTTRWNLSDNRDQNAMSVKQISEVIGMDFYSVFKPNTVWEDVAGTAMQRLANGEEPGDVFEDYDYDDNGYVWVYLGGRDNIVKPNDELLSPNHWFDSCGKLREGFAKVFLNGKFRLNMQM